jgi:hypothetical protein
MHNSCPLCTNPAHCASFKVNLQNDVTQNFVEPLRQLEKRDLKQVAQHRKNHQGELHQQADEQRD